MVSRQIAEDMKFQIANGLRATDYDCLQGYWATTGPSYYVLARLLWDAAADPEQLLAEFYGAFGPMGPIAKEYFDYWENFTVALGNNAEFFALNRTERLQAYPKFYTDAVLTKAQAILDKAAAILPTAPRRSENFSDVELGLQHGTGFPGRGPSDGRIQRAGGQSLFAFRANRSAERGQCVLDDVEGEALSSV